MRLGEFLGELLFDPGANSRRAGCARPRAPVGNQVTLFVLGHGTCTRSR